MRKLILFSICAFLSVWANAATLYSIGSGLWSDGTKWSLTAGGAAIGGTILANDNHTYNIQTGYTIDFAGYVPDGTATDNRINIKTGATLASTGIFNSCLTLSL